MLWRIAGAWSLTGLIGCCVVSLVSLFPPTPPVPTAVALVLFLMAFESFVIGVAAEFERRRQEALTGPELPRVVLGMPVPTWLTWWMVLSGVLLIATTLWALTHLAGTPEVQGGRYFFDDHGTRLATTEMGYREGLRRQVQLLTGVPGIFHLVASVNLIRLERSKRLASGSARAERVSGGSSPNSASHPR